LEAIKDKLYGERSDAAIKSNEEEAHQGNSLLPPTRYFDDIPYGPFSDLPQRTLKERYDSAIELLTARWSSLLPCPVAVYQIGQVGAPGISDLDLVVVFRTADPIDWRHYQPEAFPNWVKQLMTHPPYCCVESDWSSLPAWLPFFALRHCWGSILQDPKVPEELSSGCAFGLLVDYLIAKIPRDILWIAWERPLRVRTLLCMLHSFKYVLKLAGQVGIALPANSGKVISEVDLLRTNWFEGNVVDHFESLSKLCGDVCELSGDLISQVQQALLKHAGAVHPDEHQKSGKQNRSELFEFATPWNWHQALKSSFKQFSLSGRIHWFNPSCFLNVLAVYSEQSPGFRKYLRAHGIQLRDEWNGGAWRNGLLYHAQAMTQYSERAMALGVPAQKYIALGYSPQPSRWTLGLRRAARVLRGEINYPQAIRRQFTKTRKGTTGL
jgi:hypothetical protein